MPSSTARRGPAAGGVVAQAHRRDRERAARRQGQGARRAVLRAARRQGARPHPRLLVALRDLAHQSSELLQARHHRPRRRQGDRPRGAREGLHAPARPTSSSTRTGKNPKRLAAGLRLAVLSRAQRRPERAAQPAHASGSDARRRRARRRPAARPQLQRQDRRLSEDPARDRRPRHVLDRDRQLQSRRRSATSAARARIRSRRARRCSACASSCPTSASRRWTSPSSTRRGTACGSR